MNFHAKSGWKSFCSTFLRALTCAVTWRKGSRAKRTSVKPAVILLYVCTQQDDTSGFNFFFFSHLISHIFFSFCTQKSLSFISVVFFPLSFPSSLTGIPKRLQGCLHYWLWHVWKEGKMIFNGVVIVPQGSKPASQCPVL